MLDINLLRLVDEDLPYNYITQNDLIRAVADAQLAKALWGIQVWLGSYMEAEHLSDRILDQLQASGISKPVEYIEGKHVPSDSTEPAS